MATPAQVIKAMSGFDSVDALDRAVDDYDNRQDIIDLNRSQLRDYGTLSTGKKIRPLYADSTRVIKKKNKSKTTPTPDLYDSGDMSEEMDLKVIERGIYQIDSITPYTEYLKKKYTGNIFGVSPSNLKLASRILLPDVQTNLKRLLKL